MLTRHVAEHAFSLPPKVGALRLALFGKKCAVAYELASFGRKRRLGDSERTRASVEYHTLHHFASPTSYAALSGDRVTGLAVTT